jgi:hypothetical protein
MPAPVASGWSESPGGACTHWKAPPCHGAHPLQTFGQRFAASVSGHWARWRSFLYGRFIIELEKPAHAMPAELQPQRVLKQSARFHCWDSPAGRL